MEPRARGPAPRWQQPEQGAAQWGWRQRTLGRRSPQQRWGSGRPEPGSGRAAPALDRPRGVEDAPRSDRPDAAPGRAGREGLVTPALWLLVAMQSAPPDVTARVDRARLPAGDELTLTIRARSRSAEPVALVLPGLTGFTIVGSREVTEVALEAVGGPVRTMTRELRLKTQRPGTLVIGPVRVRQGRGEWMDLFVAHQALFPLAPGRIVIPPATVAYAVPVGFSVFKREERYSLHSDTVPVTVLPLPATRRPADDQPVAAQGLALDLALDPPSSRVGEPITITVTVSGAGNVALWPEPAIRRPRWFRARLGGLEGEFRIVRASHVPDQPARDGDGLARALRAAGVDSAVADHVKRLRDRLRASRYGPRGLGDAAELTAELEQVLRVLGAETGGKGRRVVAAIAHMALVA